MRQSFWRRWNNNVLSDFERNVLRSIYAGALVAAFTLGYFMGAA